MSRSKHSSRIEKSLTGEDLADAQRIGKDLDSLQEIIEFSKTEGGKKFINNLKQRATEALSTILSGDTKNIEMLKAIIIELKQFYEAENEYQIKLDIIESFIENESINIRSSKTYTAM